MKALIPIVIAAIGITTAASPARADQDDGRPAEVTTGRFQTLPGGTGLGYDVSGGAVMIRTDRYDGHTRVIVRARGLDPDTVYPLHVHNQACSATPAGGGHYQNVIGGPVDAVNEIWPTVTTGTNGGGIGFAVYDARACSDAMSIVIHYPVDTSIRLACADLS